MCIWSSNKCVNGTLRENNFRKKKKKEWKPYFNPWRMNGKWRSGCDEYHLLFLEAWLGKKARK